MSANNKILVMVSFVIVFVASNIVSNKLVFRFQDLGQFFGLGGVVAGYFVTKIFKK